MTACHVPETCPYHVVFETIIVSIVRRQEVGFRIVAREYGSLSTREVECRAPARRHTYATAHSDDIDSDASLCGNELAHRPEHNCTPRASVDAYDACWRQHIDVAVSAFRYVHGSRFDAFFLE